MTQLQFKNQKKQALSKLDKSFIGSIDKKILALCNTINKKDNLYTLSSCSGRICILNKNKKGKQKNIWIYTTHKRTSSKELQNSLKEISETQEIELRQESAIIHIATQNTNIAKKLLHIGKTSGFNQVGIITIGTKTVVELICDIQYIIPTTKQLISKDHLKYFTKKANQNLLESWRTINTLKKQIKKLN